MATIIAFHEVDNVDHWLHSPKRQEAFGPMGITGQLFTDPANSNRVGLILNVPDMEAFQKAMQSEEAADAMRFDGVRPETLLILDNASDHLRRRATGYAALGAPGSRPQTGVRSAGAAAVPSPVPCRCRAGVVRASFRVVTTFSTGFKGAPSARRGLTAPAVNSEDGHGQSRG
jgi:hypothetical protein